jgi:tetratricopeptide (TPR) repeat protein
VNSVFTFALIILLSFVEIGLCQQGQLADINRNSLQKNLSIAQSLINNNEEDSALLYLDACLFKKYDYPEALFLRARIYNNKNLLNKALTDYNVLIVLAPDNTEALYFRGIIRYQLAQYEAALEDFQEVLKLPATETQTAFFKIQQGSAGVSGISTLNGMKADVWNNIGLCYQALDKTKIAIDAYNQGIVIEPGSADLYVNRALSFEKSGNNKLALKDYEYALSIDPNHAIAQYNLIKLKMQDEPDDQLIFLNRYIEQNPDMAHGYAERGFYFYESSDYQSALKDLQKAVELDSENIDYLFNLALTNEKLNNNEKAERLLDEVISIDVNHSRAYFNLGNIQFKRESYADAISLFTIAHQLEKDNPAILYNRAISKYKMGRIDAACEDMKLVNRLDAALGENFYMKNCSENLLEKPVK